MGRTEPADAPGPAVPHADDVRSADSKSPRDTQSSTWPRSRPEHGGGYVWDTWELPADQRQLLFKVNAFILTSSLIVYFSRT